MPRRGADDHGSGVCYWTGEEHTQFLPGSGKSILDWVTYHWEGAQEWTDFYSSIAKQSIPERDRLLWLWLHDRYGETSTWSLPVLYRANNTYTALQGAWSRIHADVKNQHPDYREEIAKTCAILQGLLKSKYRSEDTR